MRHSIAIASALIIGAGTVLGAGGILRNVRGAYEVETPRGIVSVQPVTDEIFRVTSLPLGSELTYRPSQSAILKPEPTQARSAVTADAFLITSPTTTVRIDRKTGDISFLDVAGEVLLSEAGGVDNSGEVKRVSFDGTPAQYFLGGGERGHAPVINGDSLSMYNRQNYGYSGGDPRLSQMGISVPYFVSDRGYGVLFDDYNKAAMTMGDTISYVSETAWPLSYYFINGRGDMAGATEGYTALTGRQPLPPIWTLGYITSKYGYHNRAEAEGAVDSLKTRGYPLDGIVLDLYWYGEETDMGRLAWDSVQWPGHKEMLRNLKDKGVNTVIISQPYVNKIGAIDNYNYLSSKGMLVRDSLGRTHDVTTWVGDAGMIDVSNPDTRAWLWKRLRSLAADGVAGWWGDLGEPEVHPSTIRHANGETAEQYHNVYGNEWSRLIYEGLREDFPDTRPMLMMRGGTAGLQRYGVFPWTTDVSRSWGGLEPQINLMLSSGVSGLGYMGSDLGGFAVDKAHPSDEELYVRWVQAGAFTPMMRTHAQYKPEPYHYPASENILKKFIRMRYEWLPYNYTLAYENAAFGLPLARPLNFRGENPGKKYADVSDEYLWGDNVLVAPVVKKGARSRKVLFPAGEWVDWNDPRLRYKGGTEATVKAPLDCLPLFVRSGSFIPQYTRPIENTTEYDPRFLTVKYFPSSEETSYTLFDDDRKSPTSLADGKYQLINFSGQADKGNITISLSSEGEYEGMPDVRMLDIQIVGTARPKTVTLGDGTELPEMAGRKMIRQYGYVYDAATRTVTATFPWNNSPVTLHIISK